MSCPGDWPDAQAVLPALPQPIPLCRATSLCGSPLEVDGAVLHVLLSTRAMAGLLVGPVLDASVISDEGGRGEHGSFTGAFVGMVAFDTSGTAIPADFDWFSYSGRAG